jgi:hypothetical protein
MIDSYNVRTNQKQNALDFYKSEEIWSFYLRSKNLLVSNKGNVKSFTTNKLRKTQKTKQGYESITFKTLDGKRKTKHLQRIVAETFIPCKNKQLLEVNHINGNKSDNSVENLEWTTRQENLQHARDNNLFKKQYKESNGNFKYSEDLVKQVKLDKRKYKIRELSKMYNLTHRQISHILYRR